mgnify:CR=1 FL=1
MNEANPVPPPIPAPDKKERDWAMYTHLSGLCTLASIPSFVGPLICWMIKKDEMPKVDFAGKEALNFQLTMLIIQVISLPLAVVGIGFVTLFAAAIVSIVFAILAAVEANKGVDYIYPISFRLIK